MSEQIETHVLARFEIIKKIGSGAYGHVWKVTDKRTRAVKALKKNFDAFSNATDAQRTYREIMFLLLLTHPNIVHLEEVIRADNNRDIYLVFEHLDVDLYALIREDILAEKHRKFIFYQVARALYYLHSAGLIHRDLKPSNVLVNESCEAKLCDFGLVRSLDDAPEEPVGALTEYIATRWYRAPEILVGSRRYSRAIDIWSMGCLLAEMQRGRPLFAGTSTLNQLEKVLAWTGAPTELEIGSLKLSAGQEVFKMLGKIRKGSHREMVPQASDECLNLIEKMLEFDPDKRISITEILAHPYLKDFERGELPAAEGPVRVPVDDNERLTLKEYRGLIYEEIRKKSKSAVDVNSSTLYRIKQTVRRNPKKEDICERPTVTIEQPSLRKKSLNTRPPVPLTKGRNVKTIEKEWQPVHARQPTILFHQNDKLSNVRMQQNWARKKRSTTEINQSKKTRVLPSPADLKHKPLLL